MFIEHDPRNEALSERLRIRRRLLQIGGVSLVGCTLLGALPLNVFAAETAMYPGVDAKAGGHKPTYLPQAKADAVAHSVAENLFWNEQMLEHAVFFLMLMPGPALASQRAEVEKFKATFTQRLTATQSATPDAGSLAAFNQLSIDAAKRFGDFKRAQSAAHAAGKTRSLVWPTFFDHTAREADHFASRLTALSKGDLALDRSHTIDFWASTMGEHADFVAHLLDPEERELIKKAMDTSDAFRKLRTDHPADGKKALSATEAILDFKIAAEQGIDAGKIKSIIDPALADHVRREALKAADELRRVA